MRRAFAAASTTVVPAPQTGPMPSLPNFRDRRSFPRSFQPDLPERWIARVKPKRREQFGMMFGTARRKHSQITFGKTFPCALIDAVQGIHETIAERIGVDIKGRVDEMRDIGPIAFVIGAEMKRLNDDPAFIDGVLVDGARRARAIAAKNMACVKDILGFVR